jgi:hypothetical protein
VKSVFRLICVALMFGGWIVAALCVHVIRTPDPANAAQSKLVVLPKDRIGYIDTYIDARGWTMADVPNHGRLLLRMLDSGMADQLTYLGDPKSKESVEAQITHVLSDESKAINPALTLDHPARMIPERIRTSTSRS